jgi:HopJ type III effector protein
MMDLYHNGTTSKYSHTMYFHTLLLEVFAVVIVAATAASAFVPSAPILPCTKSTAHTFALYEIRPKTEKAKELAFGWDGTTALGGAVEVAKPARMLDAIRAAGETIPSDCEVFNANVEMDADSLTFEEVIELIDKHYESQLLEFKNGDIVNKQGENEGSAKLLSYAALSNMDKDTTLKLWGQYYREVLNDADGTSHANIRNFMKYGWDGVPFENGIALTRKAVGETEWDEFAESWIP